MENDEESDILAKMTADARKTEKEEESAIDSIAAGLDELMGDLNLGTDLIGEGEEL